MATVYLSRDIKHDRQVALKVMHPELAATLGPERFLREIRTTARLDHPHILSVLDSGEAAELLWYTMPFVDGESLRDRLRREIQLPVDEAVQLAREVADALAYAHEHGLVHRDIKPENILLSRSHARVADFGIARAFEAVGGEQLTETGLAVGTPAYMSPEQASGGKVDGRSDVYALGCVLYEMLAGEPPYTGPTPQAITIKRLTDPVPAVRKVREVVPEFVEHALARALAKVPADRFQTAADFARGLSGPIEPQMATVIRSAELHVPPSRAPWRFPRPLLTVLGVMGLLALGVGAAALLWRFSKATTALDADLVAIAPFDVLDPSLGLWREGLVDVLSRNLDGAGPFRTVPPTLVIRRWQGRADPNSAAALGRATGARLAVFGSLVRSGRDSVRLAATVLDVQAERRLSEVEVRDEVSRMDRLSDSLTVALLRDLGQVGSRGVQLSSVGTKSLPALKAFLQAEQYYRRGAWDSATAFAERAVALDSTFGVAYHRLGWSILWRYYAIDPAGFENLGRAGTYNRRLAPRDSLILTFDSVFVASGGVREDSAWTLERRSFATIEEAVRRYPGDPEAWYLLGEIRTHQGGNHGVTTERALDAFERAIALDSLAAPSYLHAIGLRAALGDLGTARRYAAAGLLLEGDAPQFRLLQLLLDPAQAHSPKTEQLLQAAPLGALLSVHGVLVPWPDSAETAVRVVRHLALRRSGLPPGWDPATAQFLLGLTLLSRGHLREAYQVAGRMDFALLSDVAPFSIVPQDTLSAELRRRLTIGEVRSGQLEWWAIVGDTNSLRQAVRLADSLVGSGRADWRDEAAAARGYLALGRRDTTEALNSFLAYPDTLCLCATRPRLVRAQLLRARGRDRQALASVSYARIPADFYGPADVLAVLERGRLAERLGEPEAAVKAYHFVMSAWVNADQELKQYVAEARGAVERLTGATQ